MHALVIIGHSCYHALANKEILKITSGIININRHNSVTDLFKTSMTSTKLLYVSETFWTKWCKGGRGGRVVSSNGGAWGNTKCVCWGLPAVAAAVYPTGLPVA